jgi:type I restriction enzyme S subunit
MAKTIPLVECWKFVGSTPKKYEGRKRYVSTGALEKDHINEADVENVTYEERPSRANLEAVAGDILFAKMASTEKTFVVDDVSAENIYSTGFCAVRADETKILPKCLYYFLSSPLFLEQKDKNSSGATQKAITNAGLAKITIKLPTLADQRMFVMQMDLLTDLISARKAQLEKLDQLVKSRFIELFGDPVYNSVGLPTKKLSELGSLDRGRSQHRPRNDPKLLGGPYPLIQTGEVASAGLYITDYKNTYSELGLRQSKMWKAGTLCITIAANIAQTAILAFDACFPDSVVGFVPNKSISAVYMHYWFGFFQKILEEQAPQVAQKNINLKILSELDVMVPPIELQDEFIAFVEQTDKSKLAIQQSLDKLELLKKSLMQEYFG